MNTSSSEQRLTDLEIRLTYQQRLIDQLNEIVTEHTMQLLKAEKQLGELLQRNELLQTQLREHLPNLPHEKPPHY
ncbi:MAG: SlyX family protein [Pirellulales bacterium]